MYLEQFDAFKEYLEANHDIEKLKEKYNEMDEDFTEGWLEDWDEITLQSFWISL